MNDEVNYCPYCGSNDISHKFFPTSVGIHCDSCVCNKCGMEFKVEEV